MDSSSLHFFPSPLAPVNEDFFEFMAGEPLQLFQRGIQRMSVVIIPCDVQRPDDYATFGSPTAQN